MDLQLANRIVIISGGAQGIGAAIARSFAAEGAIPCLLDSNENEGDRLVKELVDEGRQAVFYNCELTDSDAIGQVVSKIQNTFGRIDCVVNNAGVNDSVGLDAEVDEFRASLERNLIHLFSLTKACLPALADSRGTIINIGSKCAVTGQGGTSAYAAAKGGVHALTREWALDLAPRGIRVNCVIPAEVMTPLYESWLAAKPNPEGAVAAIEKSIPLEQRLTRPEEIADAVVFAASPRSSHTTGQLLYVDGGYTHFDRAYSNSQEFEK